MKTLVRKTKRLTQISASAKKAKQFQRTDYGGRNQIEALYEFIDKEIIDKGGKLSKDTKFLVAKAMRKLATDQVASCRKRTQPALDEIIELSGG